MQRPGRTLSRLFIFINLVLILILPPPTLEAADREVHLEVIVTTASRTEEPVEEVSGSVTIITETTLDTKHPTTLPDTLRDVPSVHLMTSGSIGESAVVQIRGAERYQSLILLDGLRLNTPFRGSFNVGSFMMDNVGQIEIVRGPQSALYGSEAMGGVINIITRSARQEFESFVFAEAGTFKTFRGGLGFGGNPDWGNYTSTVTGTDSEGDLDHDSFNATNLSTRLQFDLSPTSRIILIPRYQKTNKELPVTPIELPLPEFTIVYDDNNEIEQQFFSNLLEYQKTVRAGWDLTLRSGIVQTTIDWDNPVNEGDPIPYAFSEDSKQQERSVGLQQNFTWMEHQVFTLGLEYIYDKVEDDFTLSSSLIAPIPINVKVEKNRQNRALYAQQLFKLYERWALQIGARVDHDSYFGSVVTPRISTAYDIPNSGLKVRASLGSGYRAPTIQELNPPFGDPPNLEPEESQSWELGLTQRFMEDLIYFDVVYFQMNYEELIERTPAGAENIGEAKIDGVELGLSIHPHTVIQLRGNYAYLDTEKKDTGKELAFRSRHRANINLRYIPVIQLILNLDVNIVSSQKMPFDFIDPDGEVIHDRSPGYERLDFEITYEFLGGLFFSRNARAYLRINNLLDEDYQEVPGFPAPGRQITAGLKATF